MPDEPATPSALPTRRERREAALRAQAEAAASGTGGAPTAPVRATAQPEGRDHRASHSGASHGRAPQGRRKGPGRAARRIGQATVLAAVVATTGAFAAYHHEVELDVDGTTSTVTANGWTVGDVLSSQGVHLGPDDIVVPATSTPAQGVDEVVVRSARSVQVEVNGTTRTITTTAATVGELLDALGERDVATASASRSEPLGREPLRLVTSKTVRVLVDGQVVPVSTDAATVGDVLTDAGVRLGPKDAVSAPLDAAAVDGMVVVVTRGRSTSSKVTEVVAFDSREVKDPSLLQGQRRVETEGRVGEVRSTYTVVRRGGVEVSRTLVSRTVVTTPVTEVVRVGTLDPSQVVVSPSAAKAVARSLVAARGWDSSQYTCLVSLWTKESGWNVHAQNASSGAYGIAQALPGSKMASVGADWRVNATTQITWGLGYIAGRYGTPCGAWSHSQSTGWY